MLGWRLSEPFRIITVERLKEKRFFELKKEFLYLEKKILLSSFFVGSMYALYGKFILELWIGKENLPSIPYMYVVPAIVVILSVMQEFYISVNYYTKGLTNVILYNTVLVFVKVIFIIFLFEEFNELAPIIGWMFALLFLIVFYRKNSLMVLKEKA